MKIIKCEREQLDGVSSIFMQAFRESIEFFTGPSRQVKPPFTDIFTLLFKTYRDGFFVAVDERDNPLGYILMVVDIKILWVNAVKSGYIFKIFINWFTGKYGIGLKAASRVLLNKIYYLRFAGNTENCAQILSVAVKPGCQGKGIGKKLVSRGLEYLKDQGVKKVKLEVRPGNNPAVSIYESFGFRPHGEAKDLQGKWLIMKCVI